MRWKYCLKSTIYVGIILLCTYSKLFGLCIHSIDRKQWSELLKIMTKTLWLGTFWFSSVILLNALPQSLHDQQLLDKTAETDIFLWNDFYWLFCEFVVVYYSIVWTCIRHIFCHFTLTSCHALTTKYANYLLSYSAFFGHLLLFIYYKICVLK